MIDDKIVEDALSAEYRSSTNVDNLKFNGSKVRHFLVGAPFKNPNQVPSLWLASHQVQVWQHHFSICSCAPVILHVGVSQHMNSDVVHALNNMQGTNLLSHCRAMGEMTTTEAEMHLSQCRLDSCATLVGFNFRLK